MATCLIALGSNLGDRAEHLRQAAREIDRTRGLHVTSRSTWHETSPVGGLEEQGPFLNGAVLASTTLEPAALLSELLRIESAAGRMRAGRWEARTVDLDLLLYGDVSLETATLAIPHPRMHYRRFVLAPAAEVASAMIHPGSGWTVARLLAQLDRGANVAAVATSDPELGAWLAEQLNARWTSADPKAPLAELWKGAPASARRPKLILALPDAPGGDERDRRKILHLPANGPVAWLAPGDRDEILRDAMAAVSSVWTT